MEIASSFSTAMTIAMGLVWLLIIAVLLLAIAALVKYLRSQRS